MKTHEQILQSIRARKAGQQASEKGENCETNPYPIEDDLHWDWLNAWCVGESEKAKRAFPDKVGIPFLR